MSQSNSDSGNRDFENKGAADKAFQEAKERAEEQSPDTVPQPDNLEDAGMGGEEQDEHPGFVRTQEDTIGHFTASNDQVGVVQFYKPTGIAGNQLLNEISRMEEEGASISTLTEFAWHTLDDWAYDDEKDYEYWQKNISIADAIKLLRNVGLGGNPMQT
jgi:hypothetical protein